MKCETCKHYWNNGKDEYCEKRGWDFKRTDCPDFQDKSKPFTNADRICAMSDEELAEFIANAVDCCNCKHPRNGCSENDETCAVAWLDWLMKEAM